MSTFPPATTAHGNCPRQRSDLSVRILDSEIVVFDRQAGLIHQLNQTASYVWQRCDGMCTVADLAHQLSQHFDVAPATAAKDVAAIIVQLQKLNLLQTAPE